MYNRDYTSTKGKNGTLTMEHNGTFYYYDGKQCIKATFRDSSEKIVTLKSTYYTYKPNLEVLPKSTSAYQMIFGEDNLQYYMASPYIYAGGDCASFGVRGINKGKVGYFGLWGSNGASATGTGGVRAVVSLATDVDMLDIT